MPAHSQARELIERLASETWERLCLSRELDCSQGETTITDHNLLEIRRNCPPGVLVYKARARDEKEKGFDWEWWIGNRSQGYWRYSVQAKKLNLHNRRYDHLRHRVGERFQIDILEDFSRTNHTIPLYCFYNYIDDARLAERAWNCNLPFDAEQLGCTVAPLQDVKRAYRRYGEKSFSALHERKSTLPWRCLVGCPRIVDEMKQHPLGPTDYAAGRVAELPVFFADEDIGTSVIDLPPEYYDSELGGYPKRILVIDTEFRE